MLSPLPLIRVFNVVPVACAMATGVAALWNWRVARAPTGEGQTERLSRYVRDVAIVPGTFAHRGRPGATLSARLEAALAALQLGRVRAILVSGDEAAGEVSAMRDWLEQRGVPAAQILVDPEGTRTIETMRNAAFKFRITTAIVCTQSVSMPRTLFLAESAGIDAVGLSIPTEMSRSPKWIAVEALKGTVAFLETLLPT
jgi:vancomycin permeability regulator SanA